MNDETITDTSIKKLLERAEVMISEGYELVEKVQRDKENDAADEEYLPSWKVVLRKS